MERRRTLPDGTLGPLETVLPEEETSKEKVERLETENSRLKSENNLLKAQVKANADRADFHEELIAEMAMLVYQ